MRKPAQIGTRAEQRAHACELGGIAYTCDHYTLSRAFFRTCSVSPTETCVFVMGLFFLSQAQDFWEMG